MDLATIYGLAALSTFLLAMASHHAPTIKFGMLMLLSWAASNLCVAHLGYERAPILLAPIDGVIALILAGVAYRAGSVVGLTILVLFAEEMLVHCVGFITDTTGTWGYWAALNVIFITQIAVNGGAGVSYGLAFWSRRERNLSRPIVSRL